VSDWILYRFSAISSNTAAALWRPIPGGTSLPSRSSSQREEGTSAERFLYAVAEWVCQRARE
jgi:hypothetical protein